jgi:NADH:ubiquinone oxidoreductase subunit E
MAMETNEIQVHAQEILEAHGGARESLIPVLQALQGRFGYLPEEAMQLTAVKLGMPESSVYGVASFFAQFRFVPMGREQIQVCRGTACHVRGVDRILEEIGRQLGISEGETTPDLSHSLETVACIGCCALAPCAVVGGRTEARLTAKKVRQLFSKASASAKAAVKGAPTTTEHAEAPATAPSTDTGHEEL